MSASSQSNPTPDEWRELSRLLREGADNTENTRDMAENVPEYAMPRLTQDANSMRAWALTIESRYLT